MIPPIRPGSSLKARAARSSNSSA